MNNEVKETENPYGLYFVAPLTFVFIAVVLSWQTADPGTVQSIIYTLLKTWLGVAIVQQGLVVFLDMAPRLDVGVAVFVQMVAAQAIVDYDAYSIWVNILAVIVFLVTPAWIISMVRDHLVMRNKKNV